MTSPSMEPSQVFRSCHAKQTGHMAGVDPNLCDGTTETSLPLRLYEAHIGDRGGLDWWIFPLIPGREYIQPLTNREQKLVLRHFITAQIHRG